MGCDTHVYAEKQKGGQWVCLDTKVFDNRDYRFFGWLAGVRNYSHVKPIAAGRGFPDDASRQTMEDYKSWNIEAHSASWVSVAELLVVDYGQIIEDRRTMMRTGQNTWTGAATCEPGDGVHETLCEFLGPHFFADLKRLQDVGAERTVFWFDN
jgi:hypothetical protein